MAVARPVESAPVDRRSVYGSKEFMPDRLGKDFKDHWRSWAYKARDWLGQYDPSLPRKLLAIESMTEELSEDFIEQQMVSPELDAEIRRFFRGARQKLAKRRRRLAACGAPS